MLAHGFALLISIYVLSTPVRADVIMQYFHWYTPGATLTQNLWKEVARESPRLASKGITALWLPPAYKGAAGKFDVGYGVYDRYDLGEFNQRGSVATKYGTLRDYQAAIDAAHRAGVKVYADVVLNHMMGADQREKVRAVEVYHDNRNQEINGTEREILVDTGFQFPGRAGKYSPFNWHASHFTGADRDYQKNESAIFKFRGQYPGFQEEVDHEYGNFDYLMGADIDMRHPQVNSELKKWGQWYVSKLKLDGLRLDAVKHIPFQFMGEWLASVQSPSRGLFAMGEYWSADLARLQRYIHVTRGQIQLVDVPLHYHFAEAGNANGNYDLRRLLQGTLVGSDPLHAVTFVDNHDTQPLQALQSPVADGFKPQAYAVCLLREGGTPTLFYADYYGARYTDQGQTIQMRSFLKHIDVMLYLRYKFSFGMQRDYFDDPDLVGWTRAGDAGHPGGISVLISDRRMGASSKRMCLGASRGDAIRKMKDFTGSVPGEVVLDTQGCGLFHVKPGSWSAWIPVNNI